ncbi:2-oxoglutarate-Fe(II) type oxidoreductase hxnY-like [Bradysia coprophila]|uniref:2-oxoglutarate-Fe(II) type oxidoreductase hxnY-like n=1 Tax=Bradysia coprophila TaxID=38358 RepID=UPI00187DAD06|nr:2-oxoglutarate-Fe(II) type oxidoreductase hxnY-like [Bradysia coprophila]
MSSPINIPVIDLNHWKSSPAGRTKVAQEFTRAFEDIGFAYIVNHRVPQTIIDQVFVQHRRFHELPLNEKNKIRLNQWHRGYLPLASYQVKRESRSKGELIEDIAATVQAPNQSESFIINHEHFEGPPDVAETDLYDRYLQGPNLWPQGMPDFRNAVLAYYHQLEELSLELTKIFFLASKADFNRFSLHFLRPSIGLRMLHYPPQPSPIPDGVFGSAPHCDHGFITILVQDDTGGLEVKAPNGEWISAPNKISSNGETAFLVNLGDSASKWTNDCLRATPHRVINRSGRDRYSIAFFWDPQLDLLIDTRDLGTRWCPADEEPKYKPQSYGQHLKSILSDNYADLYKTIDGATDKR